MAFPKCFYPTEYAASPFGLDYAALYGKGIRGLVFDIDNTLTGHDAPADERVCRLFEEIRQAGLKTCLLSNNDEPRVRPFADAVGSPFIPSGAKPLPKGLKKAMALMGTDKTSTLLIGDQLFTDILGANWGGVKSVLVRPVAPDFKKNILFKRRLEKILLRGTPFDDTERN